MGRATTIFNVQNRLGSAIGVAVLASILAGFGGNNVQSDFLPYQAALIGSAIFLLIALLFSLRISDKEVMSRRKKNIICIRKRESTCQ